MSLASQSDRDDEPPAIVLDTNVVLDWLVFEEPDGMTIGRRVCAGQLRWVGTASTLRELAFVLERQTLQRWASSRDKAWARAQAWCELVADPAPVVGVPLHCSDREDQKFIDLALAIPARWLVSHDKAVLRLARRAAQRGLVLTTPARWCACEAASAPDHST